MYSVEVCVISDILLEAVSMTSHHTKNNETMKLVSPMAAQGFRSLSIDMQISANKKVTSIQLKGGIFDPPAFSTLV